MFSHLDQREGLCQAEPGAGSLSLREAKTGTKAGGKAGAEMVAAAHPTDHAGGEQAGSRHWAQVEPKVQITNL